MIIYDDWMIGQLPIMIWTLSLEGNTATYRQTVGLANVITNNLGRDTAMTVMQVKKPDGAKTLASNTIVTWADELSSDDLAMIETIDGRFLRAPWPNVLVACRPEVAALAIAIKRASNNQTKIIQIQDPNDKSGTYRFDRTKFDLIVKQAQETVEGENVISSLLPLHDLTSEKLATARASGLEKFPQYQNNSLTVVLIGGSDEHVKLDEQDFKNLGNDIATLGQGTGDIAVITSRRTAAYKDSLVQAVSNCPNITIDPEGLAYNEALALGTSFLFDGGSGSMGAEVEFTGQPSKYFSYRGKLNTHPQVQIWEKVGIPEWCFSPPQDIGSTNEAL